MSGLIQFLTENIVLIGGLGFFGMLFSFGSMTERVMLLFVGLTIFVFMQTGSIKITLGLLAVGGILLLIDNWRRRR